MGEKWSENGILIHVMSANAQKATIIDTNRMLSSFEYMEKTKRMPVEVPRGWFQYVLGNLLGTICTNRGGHKHPGPGGLGPGPGARAFGSTTAPKCTPATRRPIGKRVGGWKC